MTESQMALLRAAIDRSPGNLNAASKAAKALIDDLRRREAESKATESKLKPLIDAFRSARESK